jgi:hypothetical protein
MTRNIFTSAGRTISGAIRPGTAALCGALSAAMLLANCDKREQPVGPPSLTPHFTMGSGSVSTVVGRATFDNRLKVKRKTGHWKASVESDPLDIAVQTIVFQPGGQSGWHTHPGPVFILVVEGQMTFYQSEDRKCRPIVRSAGQGYLDTGEHAHIARNETQQEAKNVVTYFAPPGAVLRIDAPDPGHCPFSQ